MLFKDYSHVPTVDFNPLYGFLGLEISSATAESGWELGCVYIISMFFLFLYFLYNYIFYPQKFQKGMHRKEENLTENHQSMKYFHE